MINFQYHQRLYGVDPSSIMDYDPMSLADKVAGLMDTISREVIGREADGVVFFQRVEDEKIKMLMFLVRQQGVAAKITDLLWVNIEVLENGYIAKFLTPESIASIHPKEIVNVHIDGPHLEEKKPRFRITKKWWIVIAVAALAALKMFFL
jgi:hypothetical protein